AVREQEVRLGFTQIERVRLWTQLLREWGWTQAELAAAIHVSEAQVSKILGRSEELTPEVYELLVAGKLADRAADAIRKLPKEDQLALAQRVIDEEWKVDRVERYAKGQKPKSERQPKPQRFSTPKGVVLLIPRNLSTEEAVEELRGAIVRIQRDRKI